jgi:hypothetical protein
MAMSIGGFAMSYEVENTAYQFVKFPATEKNGLGEAVSAGYAEISLNYAYLSLEGMAYWATTICAGLPSKTHTAANLYNDLSVLTGYTNLVVFYPTYEAIEGVYYRGVVVKIEQIN